MTIIIDKNDRGSRAPVAQTAHFRQKVKKLWFPSAPVDAPAGAMDGPDIQGPCWGKNCVWV